MTLLQLKDVKISKKLAGTSFVPPIINVTFSTECKLKMYKLLHMDDHGTGNTRITNHTLAIHVNDDSESSRRTFGEGEILSRSRSDWRAGGGTAHRPGGVPPETRPKVQSA